MAKLSINEKLDKILRLLLHKYESSSPHEKMRLVIVGAKFMNGSNVSESAFIKPKGDEVYAELLEIYEGTDYPNISTNNDLELLLNHLLINDMISLKPRENKLPIYRIQFKGAMFIQNGGYTRQQEIEKSKLRKTNIQNWTVGLGAVFAGVYGIFQLAQWAFRLPKVADWNIVSISVLVLFYIIGILTGIAIYLLILEGWRLRRKAK